MYLEMIRRFKQKRLIEAYNARYESQDDIDTLLEDGVEKALGGGLPRQSMAPSGGGSRDMPIGTISNGRKKIRSHPSVWVDLSTGKSHADEKTNDHHQVKDHPELKKIADQVMEAVKKQIPERYHQEAEKKLHNYLQERYHAKNLQTASNKGYDQTTAKTGHASHDKSQKLQQEFKDFVSKARGLK